MTVLALRDLLNLLIAAGYGNEWVAADHDIIYLPGPGEGEAPELTKALEDEGAHRDLHSDHWATFV